MAYLDEKYSFSEILDRINKLIERYGLCKYMTDLQRLKLIELAKSSEYVNERDISVLLWSCSDVSFTKKFIMHLLVNEFHPIRDK